MKKKLTLLFMVSLICGCQTQTNSSNVSTSSSKDSVSSTSNDNLTSSSSSTSSLSNASSYLYTSFTSKEKEILLQYIGEIIPFIPNNEYYFDSYTGDGDYSKGVNFYTIGNTLEDFNAYLQLFSSYTFIESYKDDYGDTWYWYEKGDIVVDLAYYEWEGESWIDVYVYSESLSNGGGNTSTETLELITNEGKGLPDSSSGVYNVDFTKATYVKNVTEQGYYLDGCPTMSNNNINPKVLVIPVQFSDVTASSKGYDIETLEKAFNGSENKDFYSVHDYYYISSYNKLDLDITVLDEWFTPKYESSYYYDVTMDYYGYDLACGDQMIMDEALAYLENKLDLSSFDSDGNYIIDSIVLINTLDIDYDYDLNWAYRYWNLYTDSDGYYYEYDGVSANDYLWASYQFLHESYDEEGNVTYDSSVINTYTYIHEFGHILGADDYYDTANINSPLGGCDIMDMMMGDHNPFTKFNYGWLTSSCLVVAEDEVTLKLEDFSKNGDTIIIANNWDDELGAYQEYYIVMYYTNNGLNSGDEYGYFSRDGIVVYHVNASLYAEVSYGVTYYDIYNSNTDSSSEYGSVDNLIEFIKTQNDTYTYVVGDSLSSSLVDDQGNKISYTFVVNSLEDDYATLTFTKNK